ncbi:MAG TPA: hypothetical protein VHE78_05190 [Gemmatimonadaceae bacterium]|nr:hypothetical protein [Gemmatimonadaceae bacterium]
MDRMGSGTTWIPDAVSLPSRHATFGAWDVMLHGFVFAQYDKQGSGSNNPRGAEQWGSLNWAMLMASHDLAGGRLQLRTMLSLDALGVTTQGYPLFVQTGETYKGAPLHDRQHPHDFWMELGALYERAVASNLGLSLYVAPSGEPALGPVAFMHRPSAVDNPMAPIGHHWQDATHVSFGVATAGVFTTRWKAEGSIFNGRDPDENRWDFDFNPLDSYSGRLTFSPDSAWSFTGGYGFIRSPEPADPGHSMHRMVGSIQYGRRIGSDGQWASTLMWSANAHSDQTGLSESALAESELVLDLKNTIFARSEFVQKSADDLVLTGGPGGFSRNRSFDVGSISLGYIRELRAWRDVTLGLGASAALNVVPSSLESFYGSRTPMGGMIFLRLRPSRARNAAMGGMRMMDHMEGASNGTASR